MEQPKAPEDSFGCYDCELPSYQDEVLFWLAIVSPFVLTLLVSSYFVIRAQKPIGFLKEMAISVPGGLLPAIGVALSTDGSFADKTGLAMLLVFIWSSTFGPVMVFFAQWTCVEFRAIRKRFEK
ncbi:MAG: hypothetical protein AAF249_03675 [Pseudomonadota bacterium]